MRIFLLCLLVACPRSVPEEHSPAVEQGPELRAASDVNTTGPFTNRLVSQSSPYLLQHAHNPVDWYPWGEEAFAEAARRDVPVFLSIGYAACHWCHVMEEETFEDPIVSAYLNANFVAIKVDREERPDVDSVYMDAVHALNGRGGWPASIWLTSDGKPFLAGTYYPPVAQRGRPAFRDVLEQVTTAWAESRSDITGDADRLALSLQANTTLHPSAVPDEVAGPVLAAIVRRWDATTKGWGSKKFPTVPRLEGMLAYGQAHQDEALLTAVGETLWAMDRGGIHDQVGGGFHRYTVDTNWQIPHFEKMMYDNGQMLGLYAAASVAMDEPRFAEVAHGIADWMLREMRDESGAFYSSQDADTEGEEGTTYIWTPDQVRAVLGDDADGVIEAFHITSRGNFEGHTVLTRPSGEPPAEALRARLLESRLTRAQPATDTKLVVSYNALAIAGLARAGRLLNEPTWIVAAEQAAEALFKNLERGEGLAERFPRTLAPDAPGGVLDDYSFTAVALIELYEATGDLRWLERAGYAVDRMDALFWNDDEGAWFVTADLDLLVRQTVVSDGPEPSGLSRAAQAHLLLHAYGSPKADPQKVDRVLQVASRWFARAPLGVSTLALVHERSVRPAMTFVVSGDSDEAVAALAAPWSTEWRPNGVLARVGPSQSALQPTYSSLVDKTPGDTGARAFLCFDGVCERPVSTPDEVVALLALQGAR